MKHQFSKPYVYNGTTYTELDINIENITTAEYQRAEREFKILNPKFVGVVEMESGFHQQLLANLSDQPIEFFSQLPAHEFIKLRMKSQSFLLTGEFLEI